jgi:hypothetical protein
MARQHRGTTLRPSQGGKLWRSVGGCHQAEAKAPPTLIDCRYAPLRRGRGPREPLAFCTKVYRGDGVEAELVVMICSLQHRVMMVRLEYGKVKVEAGGTGVYYDDFCVAGLGWTYTVDGGPKIEI